LDDDPDNPEDESSAPRPKRVEGGGQPANSDVQSRTQPDDHSVYVKAINTALEEEQLRRTSLQERGIRVITTSGALGTLLFAIAKFSGAKQLDAADESFLVAALFFFAMAAVLAIATNLPRGSLVIADRILDDWVSEASWKKYSPGKATHEVTKMKVDLVVEARKDNRGLGLILFIATIFEVVGVVCVAAAVAILVEHHPAVYAVTIVAALVTFLVVRKFGPELIALRKGPTGPS